MKKNEKIIWNIWIPFGFFRSIQLLSIFKKHDVTKGEHDWIGKSVSFDREVIEQVSNISEEHP